jgi:hypothetical protein
MFAQAPVGDQELQEVSAADLAASRPTPSPPAIEKNELNALIAERAYFIAERRGFEPGHDVEDWLQAEAEILDDFSQGVG